MLSFIHLTTSGIGLAGPLHGLANPVSEPAYSIRLALQLGWQARFPGVVPQMLLPQGNIVNNSVTAYLTALVTLLLGIMGLKLAQRLVLGRLKRWARRTESPWDDRFLAQLEQLLLPLGYLGVIYLTLQNLDLGGVLKTFVNSLSVIIMTFLGVRLVSQTVELGLQFYWSRYMVGEVSRPGLTILMPSIRVILWVLGLVFLLDNLGFNISAVVTGLGIGGVAIALASRGLLEDLFSYFAILLDRPFDVGDLVALEVYKGKVESIGIKTTRLRSLTGEEIVFSNTKIISTPIQNLQRIQKRQVTFKLTVPAETTTQQLAQIPNLIMEAVLGIEGLVFERSHFCAIVEQAYEFETTYSVLGRDYKRYLDLQQGLNLSLNKLFNGHQIVIKHLAVVSVTGTAPPPPPRP